MLVLLLLCDIWTLVRKDFELEGRYWYVRSWLGARYLFIRTYVTWCTHATQSTFDKINLDRSRWPFCNTCFYKRNHQEWYSTELPSRNGCTKITQQMPASVMGHPLIAGHSCIWNWQSYDYPSISHPVWCNECGYTQGRRYAQLGNHLWLNNIMYLCSNMLCVSTFESTRLHQVTFVGGSKAIVNHDQPWFDALPIWPMTRSTIRLLPLSTNMDYL